MTHVGFHPVEHRHKVIADNLNAKTREITDGLLVVFNIAIPRRRADLYIVVNIDAFDHLHGQSRGLNLVNPLLDFFYWPHVTWGYVI